jgi:hypothetical protein
MGKFNGDCHEDHVRIDYTAIGAYENWLRVHDPRRVDTFLRLHPIDQMQTLGGFVETRDGEYDERAYRDECGS